MGKKGAKDNPHAAAFKDQVLAALQPVGDVTARSMFGGFGIFENGAMFGIIDPEASLYFKVDDITRCRYEDAGSRQHRPMPYFEVPAEIVDDEKRLIEWASEAAAVAHSTSKKKK